jgi:adenylate cyclase
MFIDLRGFTRLAAQLAPGELVRLLGEYQGIAVPIVRANGGSVITYPATGSW